MLTVTTKTLTIRMAVPLTDLAHPHLKRWVNARAAHTLNIINSEFTMVFLTTLAIGLQRHLKVKKQNFQVQVENLISVLTPLLVAERLQRRVQHTWQYTCMLFVSLKMHSMTVRRIALTVMTIQYMLGMKVSHSTQVPRKVKLVQTVESYCMRSQTRDVKTTLHAVLREDLGLVFLSLIMICSASLLLVNITYYKAIVLPRLPSKTIL
mmetsp:Transcript_12370/g.11957  ORF Transcript_12370/g.11957 Transcript_12370/m.11957 type:complete len:208 (+) Transcript_12370:650-1273(+)